MKIKFLCLILFFLFLIFYFVEIINAYIITRAGDDDRDQSGYDIGDDDRGGGGGSGEDDYFDYTDQIIKGNISDLPDGGNSYSLIISDNYPENNIPTIIVQDEYQLEGFRERDSYIEYNPYNDDPTRESYPLDMEDNENNLPFGGSENLFEEFQDIGGGY